MGERETDKKLAEVYQEIHGGDPVKRRVVELFDDVCIEKRVVTRKGERVPGGRSEGAKESYLSDSTLIEGMTDVGFPIKLLSNRFGVVTIFTAAKASGFQSQNSRPSYLSVSNSGIPDRTETNFRHDPTSDFGVWALDFFSKASKELHQLAKNLKAKSTANPS